VPGGTAGTGWAAVFQPVRPLLRRQLHGQAHAPRLQAQVHLPLCLREGRNQASGLRISARIDTTSHTVISVPYKALQMSGYSCFTDDPPKATILLLSRLSGVQLMSYEHLLVAVDLTEECDPVIKRAKAIA
jgi:hypothetical protein